jgi:hypothetical protein
MTRFIIKYSYNNIVSTITYRVVKQILKFNILKFIFMEMYLNYKLVIVLILILALCVLMAYGLWYCSVRVLCTIQKFPLSRSKEKRLALWPDLM